MKPVIAIVVAMGANREIGKDNQLIWHMPADLKRFKAVTMGHPMVMGRKTFESIGKPLPGRTSVIVTKHTEYKVEGCLVTHSLTQALDQALQLDQEQVSIIGGAEIFSQFLAQTNRIYLTQIHQTFDADTFFPEIKQEEWKETDRQDFEADEKNPYPYSFIILEKI